MTNRHKLLVAARCIASGGILAYPTEAVFGLGCDPCNPSAVQRLLTIKQRPAHKGLILVAAEFSQLAPFVELLDDVRMADIYATWPGPVTWLLPARAHTPRWLRGGHDTLAVRVTAHPIAAGLCASAGMALVSTSANISHRPPARNQLQVRLSLGADVDLIIAGRCGPCLRPTMIRDGVTGVVVRP